MTKSLLAALIALTALAPAVAQAQLGSALGSPDPAAPAYGARLDEVPNAPRRITLDPEIAALRGNVQPEQRLEDSSGSGVSFGASVGHAWAGFGIGVGAGGLAGFAITAGFTCANDSSGICMILGFAGAGFGAATISPLGAALGGSYLGAGLGFGIGALLAHADGSNTAYGLIIGPIAGALLSTFGAAAGYQLSSHGSRDSSARADAPMILPMLDADQNGATAGVAGTF